MMNITESSTGTVLKNDEELTTAAISGDVEAFNQLVERYFEMVYFKALACLWNRQTAEDLTQEVFLRAYLAIKNLRNPKCFPIWLNRITRNLANDWIKSGQPAFKMVPLVSQEGQCLEIKDTSQKGIHEMIEDNEQNRMIHEAVEKLNPELREIVLLRFMQNLKLAEIAGLLGIGTWVVRYKLKKALNLLKISLEPVLAGEALGFRPDRRSVLKTVAVVAAAAALTAETKSAIAEAGGTAQTAAVALAKAGSISGHGGLLGLLKAIPAYVTFGGVIMGVKQGITIAVIAVLFLGGGGYYLNQKIDRPKDEYAQAAADVLQKVEKTYQLLEKSYTAKDWAGVDEYAGSLSELFREKLSKPFYVHKEKLDLEKKGHLTKEEKHYLDGLLSMRNGLLLYFGKQADYAELRRLFSEIEICSAKIQESARNRETGPKQEQQFMELEKRWQMLSEFMN
jgi:RNA polymerase sigma-70 factor, ECF subfamily